MVSSYAYIYDDKGFIVAETAIESLSGYAYDDKHDGKHEDGKHDDLYPHGNNHSGKHDKDATFAYQIVQTDRTFTYDDAGKLLSATETEDNYGTYTYTYEYDLMGNRTVIVKTDDAGEVLESRHYTYNDSNQLTEVELYNGKKTTTVSYEYDADGNLISKTGKEGNDKVELTYTYTVENRLEAVYDGKKLLMAAAYDGAGNRIFQLNYNLHTDEDWKGNNGNGNGSNKDNSGSGNSSSSSDTTEDTTTEDTTTGDSSSGSNSSSNGNNGNNGNGNGNNKNKTKNSNSSANNGKGGNGKNNGNNKNNGNSSTEDSATDSTTSTETTTVTTTSTSTGNGNATNAETNNSQNQCGILFPIDSETSDTEEYLISLIKTTGKEKNYELIEYINDVNREYTEVLVEQNINGADDTSYVYGVDRLNLDRFDGSAGYYLYDPRGSVTGITNEEGQIYQSYRYNANGEITFGAPQYENEYTYNGESYNPNIESQYLRARYYDVTTAAFITEDSYLGDITEPLTLNRYNYCVSSPLNYVDPSGYVVDTIADAAGLGYDTYVFLNDPSLENAAWMGLSLVCLLVPFVSGSYVVRGATTAVRAANAGTDMVRAANAVKLFNRAENMMEIAAATADAVRNMDNALNAVDMFNDLNRVVDAADTVHDINQASDTVNAAQDVLNAADDLPASFDAPSNYLDDGVESAIENASPSGSCSLDDGSKVVDDVVEGGTVTSKPNQVHHYATDKNKTYTQAFKDIADKYGLDLDADWNKDLLPHQGRHPNVYHDFVLDGMRNIDNIANGNKEVFLDLYESEIKSVIRGNPEMLYSIYWGGLK